MNYKWNWAVLFSPPYLEWIAQGLLWTLAISVCALLLALVLGSLIGIGRTARSPFVRRVCGAYVEVFRNIPLLVQMFLWFFVLPEVVPTDLGTWLKRDLFYPEFSNAVLCLGTYTASRVAEQVRAGLQSIPKGLASAALATGQTQGQVYRHILLPLALRIVIPPLTSESMAVFKNSSLALTIGMLELTAQTRQVAEYTFASFEAFTAATVLYLVVSLTILAATRKLERRLAVPGMLAANTDREILETWTSR
jgi:glutamate/aspartate transport system permease protein